MKKFHQFLEQKGFVIDENCLNESLLKGIGGALSGFYHGAATPDEQEAEERFESSIKKDISKFTRNLARAFVFGHDFRLTEDIQENLIQNTMRILALSEKRRKITIPRKPPDYTSSFSLSAHRDGIYISWNPPS
jgi:hypothetical protein